MNLVTFFSKIRELPYIPEVVQDVLAMLDDPDTSTDQVIARLSLDPNLTAMILRLANSAHYSGARTISNLNDAIGTMGNEVVKSLILASGVATAFKYPVFFDQKNYWRNSMTIAAVSKSLAEISDNVDPNDAFTTATLHNIGEILIAIHEPNIYNEMKRVLANQDTPQYLIERKILGVTSAEVSAGLAKKWKFPDNMRLALYDQNNEQTQNDLAALLFVAKYIYYDKARDDFEERLPNHLLAVAGVSHDKFKDKLEFLLNIEPEVDITD